MGRQNSAFEIPAGGIARLAATRNIKRAEDFGIWCEKKDILCHKVARDRWNHNRFATIYLNRQNWQQLEDSFGFGHDTPHGSLRDFFDGAHVAEAASAVSRPHELALKDTLEALCDSDEYHTRDIRTEAELLELWKIDCAAYGQLAISFSTFKRQWQEFPHFPKALFYRGRVQAAIGIMPITKLIAEAFCHGEIREPQLQDKSLARFLAGNVDCWLVDGIVRKPDAPSYVTRHLLCGSILSWIDDGLIGYPLTLYAIGQNQKGENMITQAGFRLEKCADDLPDGLPVYVIHFQSERELLRRLYTRIQGGRNGREHGH